jgi:sterol desaturase/sphingolipid hydroxylase (fatty acid hydroxylase superfamily)
MIEDLTSQYVDSLAGVFVDPRKRLFFGYLFCAMLLGLLWLCVRQRLGFRESLRRVFDREVWCGSSARIDYQMMLINKALMMALSPLLLGQMAVATVVFYFLHGLSWINPIVWSQMPTWVVMFTFTLVLFVIDDCSRYLLHRLLHRIPALWAFHKVHHSACTMTPVTVYRTHPVEGVLYSLRASCVQGVVIAPFVFLFGEQVDLLSVLGVNVFLFAFNLAGSNLRHSHISIGYADAVENILMSPAQHQIHHSTALEHADKNFGAAFSVWDRLGGSHALSVRGQRLVFGLSDSASMAPRSVFAVYLQPFTEAFTPAGRALGRMMDSSCGKVSRGVAAVRKGQINKRRRIAWPCAVWQFGTNVSKIK